MMVSFVLSFFPRDVLDEILNLIESVSEDFPSYSLLSSFSSETLQWKLRWTAVKEHGLYLHFCNKELVNPLSLMSPIYSILFYPITLQGRRGTTDDFATIPFHLDLFSAALIELAKSFPVHSLILSSHLFFCLPLFLFPFTVPCRIVIAKPDKP